MKKNKIIIFDWGNIVECHEEGYNMYQAFDDLFYEVGYRGEDIFKIIGSYLGTNITSMEVFEDGYNQFKNDYGITTSFQEFVRIYEKYCDKIDFHKDVRDYEISLKDKCYIGIFSNLYMIDKKRIEKQLGLSNYDYVFLSYELGVRKPNMKAYEMVSNALPFPKEDILFIDDRLNNVESALKMGWNAYQLKGSELDKIKEVCEKFLNR